MQFLFCENTNITALYKAEVTEGTHECKCLCRYACNWTKPSFGLGGNMPNKNQNSKSFHPHQPQVLQLLIPPIIYRKQKTIGDTFLSFQEHRINEALCEHKSQTNP